MYSNLRLLCICFFFSHVSYAADVKQDSEHELQILIDVSGSMKLTDPKNLRIPAVKLLVNLLANGTKAGIWLFAEKTTVLVKTGVVNKQWKKKALAKLKKIHSRGLFTNIEDAIQMSSQHWFDSSELKKSSQQKRNLILLTDGMVDVSKDFMQSAESRERVMVDQVLLLQKAGVKVHTIALSDNADAELMDKLAFDTNGWSETAQSAGQLQKIFFKMYKKAVPQDTVPIEGNTFTVDASIKEFSVLIFKKPGAPATQLRTPNNIEISNKKTSKKAVWLSEKNYDLVTVTKPKAGEWSILAEMDPDNQVMIVTDLKFNVDEIPNHINKNDSLDLTAYFSDKHQLISREDFLSLIDISIEHSNKQGEKNSWKMQAVAGKAGLFSRTIGTKLAIGKNTIKIIADGKTFQRESVQTIEVIDSPIKLETEIDLLKRTVSLTLKPVQSILNTEMMTVQATITQLGQEVKTQVVEQKDGKWMLLIDETKAGESKIINFSIMAKTLGGKSVSPNVKPVIINDQLFLQSVSKQDVIAKSIKEDTTEIDQLDDEVDQEKPEVVEEKEPVNWIKTAAIVIGINITLIAAGFFAFKFVRKKIVEQQAQLLGRLE